MALAVRVEGALQAALEAASAHAPPKLAAAMQHAVFPGGARVRPMLCLAVAQACGDSDPDLANAAAAAVELLHCASLVHDDMPCFDNAATRRGRQSVHAAFGAPIALLAGDGLIVLAFERLADAGVASPVRLPKVLKHVALGVGAPHGIVAGQAWESEASVPIERYHATKTGALFVSAVSAGAASGGGEPEAWRALGESLGAAYQVADDLLDATSAAEAADKPLGQDAKLGRPNAVAELGVDGAAARLKQLVAAAVNAVPACPGETEMRDLVRATAMRLAPKKHARRAA
jgi:geranylgeranyl diphosphate synthase type II